jgi:hypothetical protein
VRPPTAQPPTPSVSVNIASIAAPQPKQPGSMYLTTPSR